MIQARNGEEALERFEADQVDLIVLDLMLPRVDGLEVCRRVRATSTVPIIMLTARDDEVDKVLGLELGADDYITKPFSIREFRSRVRALLRRAPALGRPDRAARRSSATGLRIDLGPAYRRGARRRRPAHVRRVRAAAHARCASRAGSTRAQQLLEASGAAPTTATRARSTSTSAICERRSSATRASRSTSSPFAASDTASGTIDGLMDDRRSPLKSLASSSGSCSSCVVAGARGDRLLSRRAAARVPARRRDVQRAEPGVVSAGRSASARHRDIQASVPDRGRIRSDDQLNARVAVLGALSRRHARARRRFAARRWPRPISSTTRSRSRPPARTRRAQGRTQRDGREFAEVATGAIGAGLRPPRLGAARRQALGGRRRAAGPPHLRRRRAGRVVARRRSGRAQVRRGGSGDSRSRPTASRAGTSRRRSSTTGRTRWPSSARTFDRMRVRLAQPRPRAAGVHRQRLARAADAAVRARRVPRAARRRGSRRGHAAGLPRDARAVRSIV